VYAEDFRAVAVSWFAQTAAFSSGMAVNCALRSAVGGGRSALIGARLSGLAPDSAVC
jgi:hypothetical protein